jgi:hypothetical protein
MFLIVQSDLFVGQITSRVFGPDITVNRLGSYSQIAITHVQISASGAATFEQPFSFFQAAHQAVRSIGPYISELPLEDIAEGTVPPELVSVDVANFVNCPYAYT